MLAKFYKALTWFCALFGKLGDKIRFWAEFKEHLYWNETQVKSIDLPDGKMVSVHYKRTGDEMKVIFWKWREGGGMDQVIESVPFGADVQLIDSKEDDSQ